MKSNEEFLEGIYSKKDAIIKKRKKKMSAIATAVCAVICAVAITGVIGLQKPEKVEEFYNEIRKFGSFATMSEYEDADMAVKETTTAFVEDNEYLLSEETYTKPTKPASEKEADDKLQYEGSAAKPVVEVLTDVAEGVADGEMNFAPETPDSGGDSASPTTALPSASPMPSTEEITDAAYELLSEEDRQTFSKDSAVATVTRYADGTQTFEVTFTAVSPLQPSEARHIRVQLDENLNLIRILSF